MSDSVTSVLLGALIVLSCFLVKTTAFLKDRKQEGLFTPAEGSRGLNCDVLTLRKDSGKDGDEDGGGTGPFGTLAFACSDSHLFSF